MMGDYEVLTMMMDCGGEIIKKKMETQLGSFKPYCCNKFAYAKGKAKDYPPSQLAVEQILCRHHEIMPS